MKKTLAVFAAFLFMGAGCPWTGATISGPAVIALVKQICGIAVPIADVDLLVEKNPTLVSADLVSKAICNAFKAQQAKVSAAVAPSGHLIVDGVLVHYEIK
jgi:hypothetical protein